MTLNRANQITIVRILLIVPFVICMLKVNEIQHSTLVRYIALIIFLVMCVSDVIDGYVARVKNQVTKLGSFLDPMADKLLITCACLLLATEQTAVDGVLLPKSVVVLIIGKDVLLLLGFIIIYFLTSQIHIEPLFIGKIGTFLQLSMVTAILIAPEMTPLTSLWTYFMSFLWWAAATAAILTTLIYIRLGTRYIEQYENPVNNSEQNSIANGNKKQND
jgi:CDP-diacylglycerol--glycerol-3-phosphate 3-phosphatidyltransferase